MPPRAAQRTAHSEHTIAIPDSGAEILTLLRPDRTGGGYRDYSEDDATRVAQIRAMIDAGLSTAAIRRYLDCARGGDHGVSLELCPNLRAELEAIAERLTAKQAELRMTGRRLRELASIGTG